MPNKQHNSWIRTAGGKVLGFEPPVPKEVLSATPLTQRDLVIRLYGMWSALDIIVYGKRGTLLADLEIWKYARRLHSCNASFRLRHGLKLVAAKSRKGGRFIPHCQCQACPVGAAARLLRTRRDFMEDLKTRCPSLVLITFTHQTLKAATLQADQVWRSLNRLKIRMHSVLPLLKKSVSGGIWNWESDRGVSAGERVVRIHAHALVELRDDVRLWRALLRMRWIASAARVEESDVDLMAIDKHPHDVENAIHYVRGFRGVEDRHPKVLTGFRLPRWGKDSRFFAKERKKWLKNGATYPDQLYMILAGYAWARRKENRQQPWFGSWHGNTTYPHVRASTHTSSNRDELHILNDPR